MLSIQMLSIQPSLLAASLLLAVSPTPGATPLQPRTGAGDLREVVVESLDGLEGQPEDALWSRALALRSLAEAHSVGDLTAVLAEIAVDDSFPPEGRLVAAAGLLQVPDTDIAAVDEALRPLLDHASDEVSGAAAALFTRTRFRRLSSEGRTELAEALLERAKDGTRAPELRLRTAHGAWLLGSGQHRRTARRELLEFLRSADSDLRATAALTLAAIGDEVTGPLQTELERLAALPGRDGELAASYIQQELAQRRAERRYKELKDDYDRRVLPDELSQFNAVLEMVEEAHLDGDKVTRAELLDAALDGMLGAMDQHSAYMSSDTYSKFYQDLEAQYGGIGAYVGEGTDGLFTITRPIYSGPAYRAGLSSEDKVVRVDDWQTLGENTNDVIKRLKGRPGTRVKLYIWRAGMDPGLIERPTDDMAVWITREQIEIPAVKVDMLPGNIGLVELREFSRVASKEMREGIEWLQSQGMEGLVFDLRSNSGGLLPEAVNVADLFLPAGEVVVSTESRIYSPRTHHTQSPPLVASDMPVAVLVDRYSASAAEIVAGALQDHGRAELIGERTFGKGSVQDLLRVADVAEDQFRDENGNGRFDNWETLIRDHDGDGEYDFAPRVKLTIAHYLLPSGRSIHRELDEDRNIVHAGGVDPDLNVRRARTEYWRLEEYDRIARKLRLPQAYVTEHWEVYRDLFQELARCDRRDPSLYPGFEEFYESCETNLPRDDVRLLLRQAVRRRAQDDRGAEFPFGDFQEDAQVQAGVRSVLGALGREAEDVEEYQTTFREAPENFDPPPLAAVLDLPTRDELARSRALLLRLRDGGNELTEEEFETLLGVLQELPDSDG